MKALATKFLSVMTFVLVAFNASAVYIYNNSVNDQAQRLAADENLWFGDEIILGANYPVNSVMTRFDFQYWADGTSGLTIDVALLYNTGPQYNGYDTPDFGNAIYTYSGLALGNTSRSTIIFDDVVDFPGGINLTAANFTLAVRFHNLGAGSAGVDLYNPPAVGEGSGYLDYWQYTGGNWQLTTNNVFGTVNFGMTIEAVPEPTVFSIFLMSGMMAVGFRRFFSKK